MSYKHRQWLYAAMTLLVIGAGCLWWFSAFERRWVARPYTSDSLRNNPMLASTRLLTNHGFTVRDETTLREALLKPLPDGTLLIAENGGMVSPEQANLLLAWVRKGNTLIMRPKWGSDADDDRDDDSQAAAQRGSNVAKVETDPVAARFGVTLKHAKCECKKKESASAKESSLFTPPEIKGKAADRLTDFTPPGAGYALQLDVSYVGMRSGKAHPAPLHGDVAGDAVRVYAEGRGHVVLVAQNYFNNRQLARYDHAEMLLGLAQLRQGAHTGKPSAAHFIIVRDIDMVKWYQALWDNFRPALIGAVCLLLLMLWTALRRFGPILPEPTLERRSLIEHIDASGRWLWKLKGGRELLLEAARAAANKAWQRRSPELLRRHPDEQIERLAKASNLAVADVADALRHPAGKTPAAFTRQIHTLRQLRKSHER
ncbi:uncharacterized protein DUF4350 [Paucimonas lemoignei]|uniref:Uncharacterized protein DUF4350 n=1 Tax=Paucimonas lemoignei TaxID=29443 RepID=A0A4R3I0P5_PAULE|nr:DUF4350 domain-containing protein [Paucimonas lemoignei]TCS37389.1 uncharacterized protein DUF4350 [Paucimonas lemoignei]